jgi:putative membrane-bound dehydrogenase-like protein
MFCCSRRSIFIFSVLVWLGITPLLNADERDPELQILLPGVQMSVVAEHPALATPTGIDVDSQGRVWLVATHTHFRPEDYSGPEHDEVLVFTDSTGDGKADQRSVFYNATTATMDLELGSEGWVYLAQRSSILRVRDSTGDGQGDQVQTIMQLETTADYPHNGLEGLAWHPNGDLIFGLGENFAKPWTLTGTDGESIQGTGEGGIFRCAADGTGLHRIARGFWNPFGICVREDGEIFAAENDPGEQPPCRLLHIVEGGDYGYQRAYGSEAHHPFVAWNGELRGTLPMIHPSGEAPCGVLPLGQGLLVPSWSDHRIDFFLLSRHGASFKAQAHTLLQGSRYFRPGCLAQAPSTAGSQTQTWYLTDWVDGRYQAHGYGRLWKLQIDLNKADWVGSFTPEPATAAFEQAARLRGGNSQYDLKTLLEMADSEDPFVARAALQALAATTNTWSRDTVATWSAKDRIHAVLALKLASADPQLWVRPLLTDSNPDVQFETLRWISDASLVDFLPDVTQLLNRSDLDFKRFEAAVATFNTLSGQSEAGIRNPELLLAKVQDSSSPVSVRAYALRLLPTLPRSAGPADEPLKQQFPKGLTLSLLQQLLQLQDRELSLEVIRTLAGNPDVGQHVLTQLAADPAQSADLRADAVAGLAAVADQHSELLFNLATSDQTSVREEALRCLRGSSYSTSQQQELHKIADRYPASADLVQAITNPDAMLAHRPAVTDTDAWLKQLDALPDSGDAAQGRRLFHHSRLAQCANCHRHTGRGNVVGPDLSHIPNSGDRRWLLQSILEPSRQMAPEYQPRTVILKDGRTFTGIRLRSSTKEALRDSNGQNRTFDRDEIESMQEATVSFMPAGLANQLTLRELRDLLNWLESPHTAGL